MPRIKKSELQEIRTEARGAMQHQASSALPGREHSPALLALGETLWVALRLNGYPCMNAFAKTPGFRLHVVTFIPRDDYAGAREVHLSYYSPGKNKAQAESKQLKAIAGILRQLMLPVLGADGVKRHMKLVAPPTRASDRSLLEDIQIACPPDDAVRRLRDRVLK